MTQEKDISGQKFGRLTAIKKDHAIWDKEKRISRNFWLFKCDCGNEKVIDKYSVMRGLTTSCGCYHKEQDIKKHTKHGLCKHSLFSKWQDIKNRCYNKNRNKYKIYGARGIKICDEWANDFENFYKWAISNGWKEHLTIERINVNGNYEPSNCCWIPFKEQAKNKTTSHLITINGKTRNLCYWLKKYGVNDSSYYYKRKKGLTDEQIFLRK